MSSFFEILLNSGSVGFRATIPRCSFEFADEATVAASGPHRRIFFSPESNFLSSLICLANFFSVFFSCGRTI